MGKMNSLNIIGQSTAIILIITLSLLFVFVGIYYSKKYKIPIIEDAAQSIGSKFNNKPAGFFGKVNCFSVHPLKNLNACGDGGFLVTDDKKIYQSALKMRNHGLEDRNIVNNFGFISRMDNLQASILNFRLKNLNKVIKKRRENAKFYFNNITNCYS